MVGFYKKKSWIDSGPPGMLVISYANFVVAARVADLLQEAMVTLSGWLVSTQDFFL